MKLMRIMAVVLVVFGLVMIVIAVQQQQELRSKAAGTLTSLWPTSTTPSVTANTDGEPVELGLKFQSDVAGTITAIKFYKSPSNQSSNIVSLWNENGQKLASGTFSNTTASGWQQVTFTTPVSIAANTVYVASYNTGSGNYFAVNENYFTTSVDVAPLHAPATGSSGGNGVYAYGATSVFPDQTYNASNYWVDVVFESGTTGTTPTTAPASPTPTSGSGGTNRLSLNLLLHGIGKGGDNANPNSTGTTNPTRPQRTVTVEVYNQQNQLASNKQATVNFNSSAGNFTGVIDLGTTLPTGPYTVKIKGDQYLRTLVPGIQTLTSGQQAALPQTSLITGDINNDNIVNIADYNILIGCYSDLTPATNCPTGNKAKADITDDGAVNAFDYNLFLRELNNIPGSGGGGTVPTATSTPTAATPTPTRTPTPMAATPTGNCPDLNATTANFASQVSAACAGKTVSLASGNYGTWSGTNKAITVKAAPGAAPQMKINFGSGASGFTLDGMTNMGGSVNGSASNITIKNSQFTSEIEVAGNGAGIVFDGNTHNNFNGASTAQRFLVRGPVTIKNSRFEGGGSDGVRLAGSATANILNNTFLNIIDDGSDNHTDMIQWYGGSNAVVRGNLFKQTISGETQVLAAYDGTSGNLIEDNVVDVTGRNWGIELYADNGSIVRHNTVVYRSCCGLIDLNTKGPAGRNTQVYDNIATAILQNNGSTASRRDHNMVRQNAGSGDFIGTPTFVGGANPTTYEGYRLSAGSAGKGAASDGLDVGIR